MSKRKKKDKRPKRVRKKESSSEFKSEFWIPSEDTPIGSKVGLGMDMTYLGNAPCLSTVKPKPITLKVEDDVCIWCFRDEQRVKQWWAFRVNSSTSPVDCGFMVDQNGRGMWFEKEGFLEFMRSVGWLE